MTQTVAVIGLGYVGLPVACLCAERGITTYGVDIDEAKISALKEGKSPINEPYLMECIPKTFENLRFTTDISSSVRESSIVLVCVPTPIDGEHLPDLNPLKNACESIALSLREGALVIIESTIFPGTMEEIVQPALEVSGRSFLLAHCPERIDPGNKKYTLRNIPRVVAGMTPEATKKAADFYRTLLDSEVTELSEVKAAEATKIMENTFRDVNIAFVNEMAKSFDKAGIDITEVIRGASTKPFGFMPHYPGAGVGGHCIAVDPYYLISRARQQGFSHDFLILARKINESMPSYTLELLEEALKRRGKTLEGSRVSVLGLAYKAGVDDTRESPAWEIVTLLKKKGAEAVVFDPHVPDHSTASTLQDALTGSASVILVTDHPEFKEMDLSLLKEKGIMAVIDGRNCLDKEKIKEMGIHYHGIGRS